MSQSKTYFAAGCFWGVEATFQKQSGVTATQVGYMGGSGDAPSYEQVCSGTTGHTEAVQVAFDSSQTSFAALLKVFWACHDPTTLNRQGPDIGTQYRSAIFCDDADQLAQAQAAKQTLIEQGHRIVTEILPAPEFFPAEDYHQNYIQKRAQPIGA